MLPPWCARAPRAPSPSPACARKGQNGVSDPLQGREGGLGRREGTPIPAKPPRFCPTPVSRSSPAPLGKGERGMRAGEPACSQSAPSSRSVSHAYPCRPAAHPQLQLTLRHSAPVHQTELRTNARARAAAHAKDTSSEGSRSCASAAATRQPDPFRLHGRGVGVWCMVEAAAIHRAGTLRFSEKNSILTHRTIP